MFFESESIFDSVIRAGRRIPPTFRTWTKNTNWEDWGETFLKWKAAVWALRDLFTIATVNVHVTRQGELKNIWLRFKGDGVSTWKRKGKRCGLRGWGATCSRGTTPHKTEYIISKLLTAAHSTDESQKNRLHRARFNTKFSISKPKFITASKLPRQLARCKRQNSFGQFSRAIICPKTSRSAKLSFSFFLPFARNIPLRKKARKWHLPSIAWLTLIHSTPEFCVA